MSEQNTSDKPSKLTKEILGFIESSSGLKFEIKMQGPSKGQVSVSQNIDGKVFRFNPIDLEDVLQRIDSDGNPFIQINFVSGHKVLLTDTLVGFKPRETLGLDMSKIPKVVTTPDLVSVFDAIEDSLSADLAKENEVEILKKVYHSILLGGVLAGFDLTFEKKWFSRLSSLKFRATA